MSASFALRTLTPGASFVIGPVDTCCPQGGGGSDDGNFSTRRGRRKEIHKPLQYGGVVVGRSVAVGSMGMVVSLPGRAREEEFLELW